MTYSLIKEREREGMGRGRHSTGEREAIGDRERERGRERGREWQGEAAIRGVRGLTNAMLVVNDHYSFFTYHDVY